MHAGTLQEIVDFDQRTTSRWVRERKVKSDIDEAHIVINCEGRSSHTARSLRDRMSLRRSAADFALPALRRRVDSFVFIREEPEEGLDICDTDADRDDFGST